jgi:hypothetical protein
MGELMFLRPLRTATQPMADSGALVTETDKNATSCLLRHHFPPYRVVDWPASAVVLGMYQTLLRSQRRI